MRKLLLLCLVACFIACGNPHIMGIRGADEPAVATAHNVQIEVEFADVSYNSDIYKMLFIELDRFPKAHPYISKVVVRESLDSFGGIYTGFYSHGTITLRNQNLETMRQTYWHEICHALQRTLIENELLQWCEIAAARMEEAKLDDWKGDKWGDQPAYAGFPTAYSTSSIFEFMSEHLEELAVDPEHYKDRFPKEYELMRKCGWLPIK